MKRTKTHWKAWVFLFLLPFLISIRVPSCNRDRIGIDPAPAPVSDARNGVIVP